MLHKIRSLRSHSDSIFYITVIVLASIFLTLLSEIIFKSSIVKPLIWIMYNPLYFLLNWSVIIALLLFLTSILNIRFAVTITSIIVILTSLISSIKFSLRGIAL